MILYKYILIILTIISLESCSIFSSPVKPVNFKGSFKISMNTTARYFKQTPEYPVSATLVNDIPYFNQIIPAGSGLVGVYKNHGLNCKIVWTGVISAGGTALSNANGVAISSCFSSGIINKADIIDASWN